MKKSLQKLGYMATMGLGYFAGLAGGLEGYAQENAPGPPKSAEVIPVRPVPSGNDKKENLEKRLLNIPDNKRYNVFDRLYDVEIVRSYDSFSDNEIGDRYSKELLNSVSSDKKLKGFFINYVEVLRDAFDNPDKVIESMDEKDKVLYDKFDATDFLNKVNREKDFFGNLVSAKEGYVFSANRDSDKLVAFVNDYVLDDFNYYGEVVVGSVEGITSLYGAKPNSKSKKSDSKVSDERFVRVAKFLQTINEK